MILKNINKFSPEIDWEHHCLHPPAELPFAALTKFMILLLDLRSRAESEMIKLFASSPDSIDLI